MEYFDLVKKQIKELEKEKQNIQTAGKLIAETIEAGGVVHTFGSGHSFMLAMEVSLRAGSLVPFIPINEPSLGQYERISGVGKEFLRKIDIKQNDAFLLISNSGKNILPIEMAINIKRKKIPLIIVTSSKTSGNKLWEFADVILDTHVIEGDASISLEDIKTKVGPVSTVNGSLLLNQVVIECCKMLKSSDKHIPILKSLNIEGGSEFNKVIVKEYQDRLKINIVI